MSQYRQEWFAVLKQQHFPEWKVEDDGKDILIKIPDNEDFNLVIKNLPDMIVVLNNDIKSEQERLRFIIGNSLRSVHYVLN